MQPTRRFLTGYMKCHICIIYMYVGARGLSKVIVVSLNPCMQGKPIDQLHKLNTHPSTYMGMCTIVLIRMYVCMYVYT